MILKSAEIVFFTVTGGIVFFTGVAGGKEFFTAVAGGIVFFTDVAGSKEFFTAVTGGIGMVFFAAVVGLCTAADSGAVFFTAVAGRHGAKYI